MHNFLLLVSFSSLILLVTCLNFCERGNGASIFKFRIVGSGEVQSGVNWMAKLISYGDTREGILCGATVIDNFWLLTAAHCALQLKSHSYITIRVPRTNKEATFAVKEAFVHPRYNNQTADNDIALLKISSDLSKRGIKPVCLVDDDSKLLEKYKDGVVIGYGLTLDLSPSGSPFLTNNGLLQNATVPIIPDADCVKTWRILSLRSVDITKYQICAGSYLHGTAPGDSGGPLLIRKTDGEYVQVGITSYGADGLEGVVDQAKFPGVYTRVSKYIPWIERVISNSSFSSFSSFSPQKVSIFLVIFSIWRSYWW